MLHITSLEEGLDLFKTLGSDIRIAIIKQLSQNKKMNMNMLIFAMRWEMRIGIIMNMRKTVSPEQ